ncbi:2OG-Fe(II) oxygenase [Fuerstiella marisgermanici]|uniref:Putative proline hydroxylase n=1 Tax=Fuerstiella marisgermanici TaxID=1891926 RepID=A0A1P8W971_9PLAN|nr:2OG-Fe(II) oxygenase [Fuerstiella marisgermanici]APZ90581.1 putative proline hydroxylase [Fuerstiella marisgermanici]
MSHRTESILSLERFKSPDTLVLSEPFPMLIAENQLPGELADELEKDFPRQKEAGYLPFEPQECGPTIESVVDQMTSPEFADAIGNSLGVDNLGQYPTMVSICRSLKKHHGRIHTDGSSKIVTALLYLNPDWMQSSDGCLRFLERIDDFEAMVVPEVRPVYGTLAAFRRADNSFHGHLPFQGERRVIQVAWLTSEAEKLRKTQRGRTSRFLKWVSGSLRKSA